MQEKQRLISYGILEGKTSPHKSTCSKATTPPTATATTTPPTATESTVVAELLFAVRRVSKAADAENLKAKLALTGFDAAVQEVEIPKQAPCNEFAFAPFATAEMNAASTPVASRHCRYGD
ncbi:MAG: hypothetical protein IPP41_07640 [Rhodocyclaceae bacterium]|nr:hypothetical protein [Rhodocyclaceae bacterium]